MRILIIAVYTIYGLIALFGIGLVWAILDDCLFGKARNKEAEQKMSQAMLSGEIKSKSRKAYTRQPDARVFAGVIYFFTLFLTFLFLSSSAEARQIDTIIIHHTASGEVSAKTIDSWHRARGWKGIGYHFLIHKDGTVENGRPVSQVGAHAKGRNAHSIGIALIGYDEFTLLQKMSLTHLIEELNGNGEIEHIERHHERCPGKGLQVEAMAKYLLQKKTCKNY